MAWDNCKKCVFISRSTYTSSLFKVLLTLKILHGSRTGSRGSTLEDIAMYMIKYFCLDGDIKSQVLATLKYGVKMNFIQKKKEKFNLILPATAIQLAPCKLKNEEIERIHCIFPARWKQNAGGTRCDNEAAQESVCGRNSKSGADLCCQGAEQDEETDVCDPCKICEARKAKSKHSTCSTCFSSSSQHKRPCPTPQPPVCSRKRQKRSSGSKSPYDDPCQLCGDDDDEEEEETCDPCNPCSDCRAKRAKRNYSLCSSESRPRTFQYKCSLRTIPASPCQRSSSKSKSPCAQGFPSTKVKKRKKQSCPKPRPPICARKRRKESNSLKSPYDDYCQLCGVDEDDENGWQHDAFKNCSCCEK